MTINAFLDYLRRKFPDKEFEFGFIFSSLKEHQTLNLEDLAPITLTDADIEQFSEAIREDLYVTDLVLSDLHFTSNHYESLTKAIALSKKLTYVVLPELDNESVEMSYVIDAMKCNKMIQDVILGDRFSVRCDTCEYPFHLYIHRNMLLAALRAFHENKKVNRILLRSSFNGRWIQNEKIKFGSLLNLDGQSNGYLNEIQRIVEGLNYLLIRNDAAMALQSIEGFFTDPELQSIAVKIQTQALELNPALRATSDLLDRLDLLRLDVEIIKNELERMRAEHPQIAHPQSHHGDPGVIIERYRLLNCLLAFRQGKFSEVFDEIGDFYDKKFEAIAVMIKGSALAEIIRSNDPAYLELIVVDEDMNDGSAFLIAQALKENTRLQCLDLSNNDISDEGIRHFMGVLETTNHTLLALRGFEKSPLNEDLQIFITRNRGEHSDSMKFK